MSMIHDLINSKTKNHLDTTKSKLSQVFALVVFVISIILISWFLSYKYTISVRIDKAQFFLATDTIVKNVSERRDFLKNFEWNRRNLSPRLPKKWENIQRNLLFTNFIIVDNETGEAIFWNINRNFDTEKLSDISIQKWFFTQDSVMTNIIPLTWLYAGKTLVSFKELSYTRSEYIHDFIRFFILSLISSIMFYLIWRKFVSHILRPVEDNIRDMQDFVHNAWHELKTPLSIIHGNLQIQKKLKKYDADISSESIEEIEKLNKLIESLIELSNIDSHHLKHDIDIQSEIDSILTDFSDKIDKKNITVDFQAHSSPKLRCNREYFYILFSNLLGNAIKYNTKNGTIHINLRSKSLSIKDSGIWIPPWKKDKIFERFYKAHSNNFEWSGIGLSLVKKIADVYGWKIQIASEENTGTEMKVLF